MLVFRTVKGVLMATAGGLTFGGVILALAVAGVVLFVLPGGLAIATIEYERTVGWLGRIRSRFFNRSESETRT